jgi:hypothetical protein
MWRTLEADGCTWEVRAVVNTAAGSSKQEQVLEFSTKAANRPPRRIVIEVASLESMDEAALRNAYLQARPIGGDHYGRPGKKMSDGI